MSTILLTGTIDTTIFNNTMTTLTDTKARLSQYCSAIDWWIRKSNFKNIVFIENSGYHFECEHFNKLAASFGKNFEYLLGTPYVEETIKYGKSYGEIKLINEAIEKSRYLNIDESFFKCTGRLIIKNVNKIIKRKYNKNNIFTGIPTDKWAFTWFFSVDKEFYSNYLYDAYTRVNDFQGTYMEHIYYDVLSKHKNEISQFDMYPNVSGISAGTDNKYHSGRIRLVLKNIKLKQGYFGI